MQKDIVTMTSPFNGFMQQAIRQAEEAANRGEVPVGAVIVKNGAIIAAAGNQVEELKDVTAHAEMLVIREASEKLNSPRLIDCDLYVTLEPCPMCAQAISMARLRRLYFGAYDAKGGGVEHGAKIFHQPTCHHVPEIYGGIEEEKSANLLKSFFAAKR